MRDIDDSARTYRLSNDTITPPREAKPSMRTLISICIVALLIVSSYILNERYLSSHEANGLEIALDGDVYGSVGYRINIYSISSNVPLEKFNWTLRTEIGEVYQQGEIALQNISGRWHGIDITWRDGGYAEQQFYNDSKLNNGEADRPDIAGGPYEDPLQAQIRIFDVDHYHEQESKSYQVGEGVISVSFWDQGFDGKLSPGDQFTIQAHSIEKHKAQNDYTFEINYKPENKIFSYGRLGG